MSHPTRVWPTDRVISGLRRVCLSDVAIRRASVYARFAPVARVLALGRGSGAGFAFLQEASRPGEQASTYDLPPPRGFWTRGEGPGPGLRSCRKHPGRARSKRLRTFCTRRAGFGPAARERGRVGVFMKEAASRRASVYVRFAPVARVLALGRGSGAGLAFMQEASRPGERASTYDLPPPRE